MSSERALRVALGLDGAVSAGSVAVLVVLRGRFADLLGVEEAAVLVAAGLFALWAGFTAASSRTMRPTLDRVSSVAIAGNGLFVVAAASLLASGVIDRGSWWVVVPAALVVGDLGLAQWHYRRRLQPSASASVRTESSVSAASRTIAGS